MDSKYIITPDGNFVSEEELYHWGIKGMKWGVRRYQNADGSLTSAGRKRYTNPDGSLNEKGKKKFGDSVKTDESYGTENKTSSGETASKRVSEMSDADLQNRVNRLRNEDAYRDLSKKLGYDAPKTELDIKIAEMEKQKKYLELQRDIKNLTPKNESKAKQLVDKLMNKVIEPAVTEAGKKFLTQYLTEAGAKILSKEAKDAKDTVTDSYKRVKEKEAKKEVKQESKQRAKEAKEEFKQRMKEDKRQEKEDRNKYTVEGVGTSSQKSSRSSNGSSSKPIVDAEVVRDYSNSSTTELTTTKNVSSGKSWVSSYSNTPVKSLPSPNISGYLPAPKDDDD